METGELAIAFNAMETERFGVRCARVTNVDAPVSQINQMAREQEIGFLSVRLSTNDIHRLQVFEDDGFRLMDTLVYYQAQLKGKSFQPPPLDNVTFRATTPADAEAVADLTTRAFSGFFGHFHADKRLSDEDCDAVYVDWAGASIRNACSASPALVAEADGQIIGFLTINNTDTDTGELTLSGVDPGWQSKGIYGRLISHGLKLLAEAGCSKVNISTQVNNIPVQKAWAKHGLRMEKSYYTLHKWCDDTAG